MLVMKFICIRTSVFFSTSGSRISTSGNRRAQNFDEISENSEIFSEFFEKGIDFLERKKWNCLKRPKTMGCPKCFLAREARRQKVYFWVLKKKNTDDRGIRGGIRGSGLLLRSARAHSEGAL